jgi:hypothetical protein
MTKYLSMGAAAIIFVLGLLVWFQERRIVGLNKTVVQLEAVKTACEQRAKIYRDWEAIDHGASYKKQKVLAGGVPAVVGALNELFNVPAVPAAPGPARRPVASRP